MPTSTSRSEPRFGMPLSPREREVLEAMAIHGSDRAKLARILGMAVLTVKSQKRRIAIKLGTQDLHSTGGSGTSALTVATAFRTGLLNHLPRIADPDPSYVSDRIRNPYTIRDEDGTERTVDTWARHIVRDWSETT